MQTTPKNKWKRISQCQWPSGPVIFATVPNADLLRTNAPISVQRIYLRRRKDLRQSIVDQNHANALGQCTLLTDPFWFRMPVECKRSFWNIGGKELFTCRCCSMNWHECFTLIRQPCNKVCFEKNQWNSTYCVSNCECLRGRSPVSPPKCSQWRIGQLVTPMASERCRAVASIALPYSVSSNQCRIAVLLVLQLAEIPKSEWLRKIKIKTWQNE